jgi:hypothetical protein
MAQIWVWKVARVSSKTAEGLGHHLKDLHTSVSNDGPAVNGEQMSQKRRKAVSIRNMNSPMIGPVLEDRGRVMSPTLRFDTL